ncbi:hypothetical protein Tco_1057342 [Tanacetum coccineum]|uniref:Reverse transcriptase Ty1/copia-type domain-containing protein n=1 Tax=Tanacetum coccineum TaxID=301880 RepID=A0ABQ5H543_9ASTR
MNTTQAQQKALGDAFVAPTDHLEFEKCNMRLKTNIKPKEATFQVVLDALALTPFYQAFLITTEVPAIYMQEFWATVFVHKDLGYTGDITYLTDVNVDYLHQPWRAFSTIINKCLSGKETGMDKIRLSLDSVTSPKQKPVQATKGTRLKEKSMVAKSDKKKQPAKKPKAKGLAVLSEVVLTEAEQLKLDTKRSKIQFHSSYASGSGDGVNTQSKVHDEHQQKTSGADEGTGTKPGVPDVPIYESKSEKESWGDSEDDENNFDDISDEGDDDNDGNSGNDDDDNDEQEGDDTNDDDEDTDKEEKIDDEETMYDDEKDEVTKELYKDVKVNLGNEDTEMTNADQGALEQQNVSQEPGFEQVEEDAHVTLTMVLDTQKADEPVQSSSVSSDFTSKLLNLENPSPADNEIASLMETSSHHATVVPEITSSFTTTIPPPPPFFNPLLQHATPAPTPTTSKATTSFISLLDFAYVFKFNDRVTNLEKDLLEIKQVDQYAQDLSIPAIVDRYMDNKLGEAINKAIQAHNFDCREEAQAEKMEYIELVDSTVRTIIKEEVNTQLPQILPQAISDVATPVIEKNVTESLEATILTRYSSQPQSSYKAAATLFEFELTKILIDKMKMNKSYDIADYKKKLYDALRSRDDRDKDRYLSAGSDRGTKRRKSNKSSGKSAHAEEPSHIVEDSSMQQDQEFVTGDNDEQPADKEVTKADCQVACAEEPPTSFDELNNTSFDLYAFVMNRLKIPNLTQEILVGPAFNLLKGTCKSITELEYHLEECSKATTERLDWHNPENKPYPFDLRKPLPLIQDHRGCQIIPQDYFINNDLEYLKGEDLSRRYSTSVTKIKAATYDLKWIKDLVPKLWSPITVKYDKHAYWGTKRIIVVTRLLIMKKYDYGHLEEIEVRREDQKLYKFREGDFLRLRIQDIEDIRIVIQRWVEDLQLGVESYQKKLNLIKPDTFSDGTLDDVRSAFDDIAKGIRIEYLPKRKWSGLTNDGLGLCQNRRDLPRDIPIDSVEVLSVKTASTPIETPKPLVKDEEASDVDVHLYRSMIGSLMYVTASRPDIMFSVCACSSGSSVDERGKTHHGKSNLFQETPKPLCSTFLPTDVKHCLNVGYTFVNITTSEASKNSLVKHFEDMRLCRPSKEYLLVWLDPPRDESMSCLTKGMRNNGAKCARRFRESLRRVTDGAEAFLILTLFIISLDKVSTDHAKLVPLGKVCTAKETLEKNTAKGTKCKLEPLISLTDDLSLLSNMAALESCPKHNMIAYLEKTEGNVEFHEVIDFLRRSYIYHALTVSPVVSTTFVEQFWTSAKSKTINNVRHITAKVAGKFVSISEASIRTDLIFDDADGIDSLPNQAIFDAIQLMGYEGDLTVSDQAKEIKLLKAKITKLKRKANPVIKHFKAYQKRKSKRTTDIKGKHLSKKKKVQNKVWRTQEMMDEDKDTDEVGLSTEDEVSTAKKGVSTEFEKVSTDRPKLSTDDLKVSTDEQMENDEELARKVQEEWEAEEEKNKIAEEEAANEALIKNFDDVKARIEADRILAEKLQEQERGKKVKDEDKDEESTRKRKLGTRKKMKSRKRRYIQHTSEDDSDKENDDLRVQHETSLEGPILEDVEETIAREEVDLGISPPNTELDEGEFEDLDIEHVDVEDFLEDLMD